MTSHIDLDSLVLSRGTHQGPNDGHCLMEAVSMWAGGPFTDCPSHVSPMLSMFGMSWNDRMYNDIERGQLKRYIPLLSGTATGVADDHARAWMALDWLIRVHSAAWVRLAGLKEHADQLEALPPVHDAASALTVLSRVLAIRDAAKYSAENAVNSITWPLAVDALQAVVVESQVEDGVQSTTEANLSPADTVWNAAWIAAGVTVRSSTGDIAKDAVDAAYRAATVAAGAPHWSAVRHAGAAAWALSNNAGQDVTEDAEVWSISADAAAQAAFAAVRIIACGAAHTAALTVIEDHTRAAGAAPWVFVHNAARDALWPTVKWLQEDAHRLFDSMIAVGAEVMDMRDDEALMRELALFRVLVSGG